MKDSISFSGDEILFLLDSLSAVFSYCECNTVLFLFKNASY